ncbi:MAG TPA: DUF1302 family protein, partial [Pseudomonadales bacterium]
MINSACVHLNKASEHRRALAGMVLAVLCPALTAQTLEEALGGFDDNPAPVIEQNEDAEAFWPEGLTGSIAVSSSWNYLDHDDVTNQVDWQGLSKLRTRLNLQYDTALNDNWKARLSGYDFYDSMYRLRGRDNYPDSVLDEYEHEAEIQEAWVQGRLSDRVDLKAGR